MHVFVLNLAKVIILSSSIIRFLMFSAALLSRQFVEMTRIRIEVIANVYWLYSNLIVNWVNLGVACSVLQAFECRFEAAHLHRDRHCQVSLPVRRCMLLNAILIIIIDIYINLWMYYISY